VGTEGDEGWIRLVALEDLPLDRATRLDLDGAPVLVYRATDRVYAISDRCTHQGAPLDRGRVDRVGAEPAVTCPAHGSRFRLSDGRVLRGPATAPVEALEVRTEDGWVQARPAPDP
jgi:nitrite reductase/ring-hydroxylating ferredoxin subunit